TTPPAVVSRIYTASFKTQYLLTTAVSPAGWGTVTASPSSGDGFYDRDISVTLTATGSFQSWSGDLSGSVNPQSVVMNAPRSVTETVTVTLTRLVAGTTSVVPPAPISTSLIVPQLAPVILPGSVKITGLSSSGFNVEFDAFSTPRDLGDLNFAFQPAAGAKLTGTSFTVPLQSLAPSWFSSPAGLQSGGSFHLSVPFTFSGDTRSIGSVSVTLSNSIGTSVPHTSGP